MSVKDIKLKLDKLGATGLKAADIGGTSDPYAILRVRGAQVGKTKVIDKTLNPSWKDDFSHKFLPTDVLEVNIYDKDKIGKDDPLGNCVIPMNQVFAQLAVADKCNGSYMVQNGTGTFFVTFEVKDKKDREIVIAQAGAAGATAAKGASPTPSLTKTAGKKGKKSENRRRKSRQNWF